MGSRIYIVGLALLYAVYFNMVSSYALPILPLLNLGLPLKIVLVAVPLYLVCLWRYRQQFIWLDYFVVLESYLVWFAACLISEWKTMSNALIETAIVAILLSLYLLRFPISARMPVTASPTERWDLLPDDRSAKARATVARDARVGGWLMLLINLLTIVMSRLMPSLPE